MLYNDATERDPYRRQKTRDSRAVRSAPFQPRRLRRVTAKSRRSH